MQDGNIINIESQAGKDVLDVLLDKMANAEMSGREALETAYKLGVVDLQTSCEAHKRKMSDRDHKYFNAVGTRVIENLANELNKNIMRKKDL